MADVVITLPKIQGERVVVHAGSIQFIVERGGKATRLTVQDKRNLENPGKFQTLTIQVSEYPDINDKGEQDA